MEQDETPSIQDLFEQNEQLVLAFYLKYGEMPNPEKHGLQFLETFIFKQYDNNQREH